jgi:hypothetical protein
MSASRSKKERQDLAGLSEKQKKAALEAKALKRKHILYWVLGIVAAVAVVALLVWDNGVVQRHLTAYTVGSHKYTAADVDYFYYSEYNSYYNTYVTYGLIDSGTDMRSQVYSQDENGNDITWDDQFKADAVDALTQMTVLYDEATANGYTISDDGVESVQTTLDSIETACSTYSVTKEYYLQYLYGPYMTEKRLKNLLTMSTVASEYAELIESGYEDAVTEDEINAYYDENADQLDTYSYYVYYISGSAASTTDEDGNTVSPTDEETEAAMAAAEDLANQLVTALEDEDEVAVANLVDDEDNSISDYGEYTNVGSSVSSTYSEWMLDSSRVAGDVTAQEGVSGYYVVRFDDRTLVEQLPVNYRDILITADVDDDADAPTEDQLADAQAKAEDLMGSVTDEQSFIDLVADNSSSSTASSEGLNSSVSQSSVSDDNIAAWLFDETHSAGDLGLVESADGTGYSILYFQGYDTWTVWQQTAITSLSSDAYNEWYDGVSADVSASSGVGYGLVG